MRIPLFSIREALSSSASQDDHGAVWTSASWLVIVFSLALLITRWPLLPNFFDIYYHIIIAQGFNKAGGVPLWDFMNYAPLGRPHLYPPLFHVLTAWLLKMGLSPMDAARTWDAVAFPAFLSSVWLFMRVYSTARGAFFAVVICANMYALYLGCSNFIPLTLSLCLSLLAAVAVERERRVAAAGCLTLALYTHAQGPWLIVIALVCYGLVNPARRSAAWGAVLGAVAAAAPVLAHQVLLRSSFGSLLASERFVIEVNLVLLVAVLGVARVWVLQGRYAVILFLALAALPFIPLYPYRYFCGPGSIGIVALAALGCDVCYERSRAMIARACPRGGPGLVAGAVIIASAVFSPTLFVRDRGPLVFSLRNSTYLNFVGTASAPERPNNFSLISSAYMRDLVQKITDAGYKDTILYANIEFADVILASLTGNAAARGMLREVKPHIAAHPLQYARVIVWFKDSRNAADASAQEKLRARGVRLIGENDIAYIFANDNAVGTVRAAPAVVSYRYAGALLFLVGMAICCDMIRRQVGS